MRIVTEFWAKPIPDRSFDWSAVDDDTYDGAEDSSNRGMIGYGRTEAEAITDLMRLFEEADDEAREDDERRRYFNQHDRSEP